MFNFLSFLMFLLQSNPFYYIIQIINLCRIQASNLYVSRVVLQSTAVLWPAVGLEEYSLRIERRNMFRHNIRGSKTRLNGSTNKSDYSPLSPADNFLLFTAAVLKKKSYCEHTEQTFGTMPANLTAFAAREIQSRLAATAICQNPLLFT